MKYTPLNDESHFQLVRGLWKGEHIPLKSAKVLRSTNFAGDGLLNFDTVAELNVEERQFTDRQLTRGDIIIERSGGGPKQPVGRVALFIPPDNQPYFSSNFTTVLRIRNHNTFNPEYVALYLHALYLNGATETLQRATTGIRNLDWSEYLQFEIPVRPLKEQNQLAYFLSNVRKAYRLERELLDTLSELKHATMHKLFTCGLRGEAQKETEIGLVPESWKILALNEVALVQTGVAKGRKFKNEELIEVPYIRVANVQDGSLDLAQMKTIRIRPTELDRYLLQEGDVLLTEGGDFDKLGRGFIWRGEIAGCIHQNHVYAVRVDRNILLPEYFAYLAQSPYGKSYFLKVAHKTTNLACINTTKLKAFPVAFPGYTEQHEIVAILDAIDQKIDLHRRKKAVLEELFKSLLHKLMTSEIQVDELDLSALEALQQPGGTV